MYHSVVESVEEIKHDSLLNALKSGKITKLRSYLNYVKLKKI